MSASEAHSRLLKQIKSGREQIERLELSDGDFNAWTTTTEDLLNRIYGKDSVALRGYGNAVCRPTMQELKDSALDRPLRETLKNRLTLLESLAESLLHDKEHGSELRALEADEDVVLEDPNKLILSWSGRTSHKIASFMYEWWRKVVPGIQPWISFEDIAKGRRWFPELMTQLGKSTTCLICVTPENHRAPWVYYEAGVISAKQDDGCICTVLFGVTTSAIDFTPLSQFQATTADKDDIWRLVRDLNQGLSEGKLEESALRAAYERHWPDLKRCIDETLANSAAPTASAVTIDLLSQYELRDEAKELLREACKDVSGLVHFMPHDAGLEVLTNNRQFVGEGSPRVQAAWKSGFDQLIARHLIEDRDGQNRVFRVTSEGYKVGDVL